MQSMHVHSSTLGTELRKQFQIIFSTVEKVFQLGVATLLDVSFKKMPFIDIGNVKTIEDRLINLMRLEYFQEAITESLAAPVPPQSSDSQVNELQATTGSMWKSFDARVEMTLMSSRATITGPHTELRG